MSVLIKGLSMPKGGFESLDLSIDSDGKVYIDERDWFGRHTYKLAGEAVSISDHGDLVDMDYIKDHWPNVQYFGAPVVIPAERSEE